MEEGFKLSTTQKWLMRITAIFFDILSLVGLIPVIGWILDWIIWLFANLTFYTWFKAQGMSFTSPKKLFSFVGGSFVEFLPEISALPMWTITIFFLTGIDEVVKKVTDQVPGGEIIKKKINAPK